MDSWNTCTSEIKVFVLLLLREVQKILKDEFIGFYLHGSLAMGGFNPIKSDIDIIVVTRESVAVETKRELAQLFLSNSKNPFPIEISILNEKQLKIWQHPSAYDFHYSESWRERYKYDLEMETNRYLNDQVQTDPDLAAHIIIITARGICIGGKPIAEVFPFVPRSHYISSIMGDFEDCIENIKKKPVYCTLNMIRVFWYLKEGVISSKKEAGNWELLSLPNEMHPSIQKVINSYLNENEVYNYEETELLLFKNYIVSNVRDLLK